MSSNIFYFKDDYLKQSPDPVNTYPENVKTENVPIVFDNGSCFSRVGWACENAPRLTFRNIIAKQRGKKDSEAQIGNGIPNVEAVRWLLKTQFDRDVVTHYDAQEQVFDHAFQRLGVDSEGAVCHPMVMTETTCNPHHCRQTMSELLFECYGVPSVAYGVDSLFSLYYNSPNTDSSKACALVLSSGFQTTYILPVVDGKLQSAQCRRLNIGGSHLTGYLLRLLQLKYPAHQSSINLSRAEELLKKHIYTAVDCQAEFEDWGSSDYYQKHAHRIQLPYTPLPGWSVGNTKERRQQCIRHLRDLNTKWKQEKLAAAEDKLCTLVSVQDMPEDGEESQMKALKGLGLSSLDDLTGYMGMLNASIQRSKVSLGGRDCSLDQPKMMKVWPNLGLLGSEPELLSPDDRTRRQRQLLVEEFHQNSLRARWIQQELDGILQEIASRLESGAKEELLKKSIDQLREQKEELNTCHSQWQHIKERMLALRDIKDTDSMETDQEADNDDSSRDDEGAEWAYIQAMEDDAEGFSFQAEQENLSELEKVISVFDQDLNKENRSPLSPRMTFDLAEYYQLALGVERIRVAETLFQPSMMGLEQAGLAETLESVLEQFTADVQNQLVQSVFVTGGNLNYNGMVERLQNELRAMRPFQSTFSVKRAVDPSLDGWRGAAKWASDSANQQFFITRPEYEESGGDYLKEHHASNRFFGSLLPKT